jgi:hypothetical protein
VVWGTVTSAESVYDVEPLSTTRLLPETLSRRPKQPMDEAFWRLSHHHLAFLYVHIKHLKQSMFTGKLTQRDDT